MFPPPKEVTPVKKGQGANTFDNVYKVNPPPPDYVIAESKGGAGTNSSSRKGDNPGERYEQGTPEYRNQLLEKQGEDVNAPQEQRDMALDVRNGEADADYIKVTQPFDKNGDLKRPRSASMTTSRTTPTATPSKTMTKLKLKRHPLHDFYAEGEVARDRERWMANWRGRAVVQAHKDPRRPGDMAPLQRRSANKMLLIDDVQSFWGFLSASVDYAVAGFRLWYAPGEVEVELCGQTLRLPGAIPGLGATPRLVARRGLREDPQARRSRAIAPCV
ncbi:MAG: hypothetical protein H6718_11540 [Polyangiaceae bacterium]|nr:hypothetical protein [Polyangiaceae bacterium]